MKGDSIPNSDHVLRHVNAKLIQGEDIDGGAFRLRKDETELSFNWMEYYRTLRIEEQIQSIRDTFPLKVKKKDKFVKLNVGQAKSHVSGEHPQKKTIDFIEDGCVKVPSHSVMRGEPDIDAMMGDLLADCILDKFPAIP